MKNFLRMFVDMPEPKTPPEIETDSVTGEVDIDALIRQADASLGGDPSAPGRATAPEPPKPKPTPLEWSLGEVFQAGGVQGGRNSADTVLTLKASLSQFPDVQKRAMIRAMDAADDTWDEATVIQDAKKRLLVLQHYLGHIDKDEAARVATISQSTAETKLKNDALIAELDSQISTLQQQREGLVAANIKADEQSAAQSDAVRGKADARREEVRLRSEEYRHLVGFFEHPNA